MAAAKDEGPYLAEWCAHHLYFGFDEIEVYLNRTSDNSIDILRALGKKDRRIKYQSCDWVDMLLPECKTQIQHIAYAHAFANAGENGFSHILLSDLDEYWTPTDLKTSVQVHLETLPDHQVVSFPWRFVQGTNSADAESIANPTPIYWSSHVKSIVHTGARIERMTLHRPILTGHKIRPIGSILPDGSKFKQNSQHYELIESELSSVQYPAHVYHAIFRTEDEFLATLARGRPSTQGLKTNRPGYNFDGKAADQSIEWEDTAYADYMSWKRNIVDVPEIRELTQLAKGQIRQRANIARKKLAELAAQDPDLFLKITTGLTDPAVSDLRKTVRALRPIED